MIERLVVHIGTHKTGTTAIQSSLRDASDTLGARGILYPVAGRGPGPGHAELARGVVQAEGAPTRCARHREIVAEVRRSRAAAVIVSAERLGLNATPRTVAWAAALGEELEARATTIAAYVRPQWEYMESSYAQQVRDGRTRAPFEARVERSLRARRFDYPALFEPWRDAFGHALAVRLYARRLLTGGDVVTDFWHLVGLGTPGRRGPSSATRGPGPGRRRCFVRSTACSPSTVWTASFHSSRLWSGRAAGSRPRSPATRRSRR